MISFNFWLITPLRLSAIRASRFSVILLQNGCGGRQDVSFQLIQTRMLLFLLVALDVFHCLFGQDGLSSGAMRARLSRLLARWFFPFFLILKSAYRFLVSNLFLLTNCCSSLLVQSPRLNAHFCVLKEGVVMAVVSLVVYILATFVGVSLGTWIADLLWSWRCIHGNQV
jgi:hypothetical protein